MSARGKNAKRQQNKDCFPISAEQCWDQQPFKGKVHTGRNWVSFCNGCCRNYLCIGLKEMVSKAASNSRLPMLHTSMSAQGATSPVLCLLKSPALSVGPRTLRKDAEGAKKSGIKNFILRCSLCTELCVAKKQREPRALDLVRRPEFNLASANF